jgi:hypothetical protein
MVAVTLKVEEWNTNGQNFAFFFKKPGTVTLLFSTTTGENLNFPTTPGII